MLNANLKDPVPPDDVDVTAEGVHGAVGLGHRDDRPSNGNKDVTCIYGLHWLAVLILDPATRLIPGIPTLI